MKARALALLGLLAACGPEGETETVEEAWARGGAGPLSYEWGGAPGGPALTAYRWDGRPFVPTAPRTRPLRIDFGAAGRSPDALAYLSFDEDSEAVASGRFGDGRAVSDAAGPLRLELDGELVGPWTLDFWIRPERIRRGTVLRAARLVLGLEPDGRLTCRLDGEPGFELSTENALVAGRWSHVALVRDAPRPARLRLVLDDRVVGRELPGTGPSPTRLSFELPGTVDDVLVEGRAAASAEALERHASYVEAGWHELVLAFDDGTLERRRLWAGTLTEPVVRGDDWARGALEHFLADENGLRWVAGQWRRDHAPSPPMPRTTHPSVFLGGGRVFVFSGEVKDSHLFPMVNTDDTWIYDASRRSWERVAEEHAPPPRCHQPAAYSPDHGLVLMCGGWRNDEAGGFTYADTWVFHVDEERWEERHPSGAELHAHSDASLVYHPELRRFLLFMGLQVWEYDPDGDSWTRRKRPEIVDEGGVPAEYVPGGSRMAGYDPETQLVVLFGSERAGDDGNTYGAPTVVYDHARHRLVVRAPAQSPSPRVRSGFAHDSRRGWFVLYGGVRSQRSTRFDDLWTYRVRTNEWRRWEAANPPTRRGGYFGMAYDPEADVHLLLAGRHSTTRFLNEAWRLRLDPEAPAAAEYVFDRAGLPDRERVVVDWSGPEVDLEVEVAGSPDGIEWAAPDSSHRFVKVSVRVPAGGATGLRLHRIGLFGDPVPDPDARRVQVPIPPLR